MDKRFVLERVNPESTSCPKAAGPWKPVIFVRPELSWEESPSEGVIKGQQDRMENSR